MATCLCRSAAPDRSLWRRLDFTSRSHPTAPPSHFTIPLLHPSYFILHTSSLILSPFTPKTQHLEPSPLAPSTQTPTPSPNCRHRSVWPLAFPILIVIYHRFGSGFPSKTRPPHCQNEIATLEKTSPSNKTTGYPMGFFVPPFGRDRMALIESYSINSAAETAEYRGAKLRHTHV